MTEPKFTIPSSLQDLEREPHNLFPYPLEFQDNDEAERVESFNALVELVEETNQTLTVQFMNDSDDDDEEEEEESTEPWIDRGRFQALYTLVRYVELCL